jgi:hypothetical protein
MEFFERIATVKKPQGALLPQLEMEYRKAGEEFGYVMVQSPAWLMLKKSGSQAAFEVQFGSREEILHSLRKLAESKSDICFFITSKKAHNMRLEDIRAELFRHFTIGQEKFVFLDLEDGRYVTANFEWDKFRTEVDRPDWSRAGPMPPRPLFRGEGGRRKRIVGRRGEHKEND